MVLKQLEIGWPFLKKRQIWRNTLKCFRTYVPSILICQLAIGRMGYPGAEVACFLGVTTSSVNRLAVSEEVANLNEYLELF